jgi:hypothetical protein
MAFAHTIKALNQIFTGAEISKARLAVDHAFDTAPDRHWSSCRNPFTSEDWCPRLDPIEPQKAAAVRAVLARHWFAKRGPADADLQPLPLGHDEREPLKRGGAPHILAWYARSLEALDYEVGRHPTLYDFARGVMASSEHAPDFITENSELQRRFPPRLLPGLISGLIWLPPGPLSVKSIAASDQDGGPNR